MVEENSDHFLIVKEIMKNSIKKSSDFKKIYDKKMSYATKNLVMYISKNSETERNRLGISVSHKVGNSVVRHTLARRIREIFRENVNKLQKNVDIIVVLRVGSEKAEFFILKEDFLNLCKKHRIIKENDSFDKEDNN